MVYDLFRHKFLSQYGARYRLYLVEHDFNQKVVGYSDGVNITIAPIEPGIIVTSRSHC